MPSLGRVEGLRRLRAIQQDRERLAAEELRIVHGLRSFPKHRVTWRYIGDALGISQQSAHQRFHGR